MAKTPIFIVKTPQNTVFHSKNTFKNTEFIAKTPIFLVQTP
jgi:hypothetical protein